MTVTSTVTDVGSMGDRKYAYGTWRHSGLLAGYIDVPMTRVDIIWFTCIQPTGGACEDLAINNTAFPYSSGAGTAHGWHTQIPVVQCSSGIASGLWFALGKGG